MEQDARQQLQKYLELFLRRHRLIVVCLFVALGAGLLAYLQIPKVYRATALIIYQRQRVNPTKMSPDVQTGINDILGTLSQQVTSRSSLEGMIRQFELYPELRARLPMEEVVFFLRGQLAIKPGKGDVFNVSFEGDDPRKTMLVTNAIAARFIEENLRFREEWASETSVYVKDELAMAKEALDRKEQVMRDFKLQYYNEMPERLAVNMERLNALQGQGQKNQDSLQDLERTKLLIQEQVTLRKQLLGQVEFPRPGKERAAVSRAVAPVLSEAEARAARLGEEVALARQGLAEQRQRYTDQHPEVRRLKKGLAELEARAEAALAEAAALPAGDSPPEPPLSVEAVASPLVDPQVKQLEIQLNDSLAHMQVLKEEHKEIEEQINQYRQWVAATPVREAEWSALTRDYTQLQNHYQELVVRNIEAESAQSLERRQKGSQFKIVDSAHYPEKPFKPNFIKIMLMAVAAGLGVGGGLALLLDSLDTSFKDVATLEAYLGVPVTCAIPRLETVAERRRHKIGHLLWVVGVTAGGVALLAAMFYLKHQGRIII